MTEIGEVGVRKRRSREEIKPTGEGIRNGGLRRIEFCQKHRLALGALQRGLKRRLMEVEVEDKRLVEVKVAGIQRHGAGAESCCLEVMLAEGRRIGVRRRFDAETLARLINAIGFLPSP